ncbi:hypothetical protein DYB36_000357 [Aphanomyces astaci]|uniref:Myb-like domain-containing protein n=3 Tax=Aphanomyces astaci TaxID=112090 RepID=A0A397ARA9_APHAT|nr:hypothetical protein DYB36_000357 [Aphanomyces astaci]
MVLGVYRLWLNWHRDYAAMALYFCLVVGSICELSSTLLVPSTPPASAATMAGDVFFVTAYLLIMYNWSVIAKRMDTLRTTTVTAPVAVVAFMAVSGLAYVFDTVVFGVTLANRPPSRSNYYATNNTSSSSSIVCWLQTGTHAGVATVSLLAIGLFPYYGHRMRGVLRRVGEDSPKRLRNIAAIATLASLYFVCHGIGQIQSTLLVAMTCQTGASVEPDSPWLSKKFCFVLVLSMSDEQGSAKRKPAHRFTIPQDVDLLKEVLTICPHDAPYGQTSGRWAEVGDRMRTIHGDSLSATGCRKRCDDLLAAFHKDSLASLRASGTDEQHHEREQLLQDLKALKRASKEDKGSREDKREARDPAVRAVVDLKRKAVEEDGESSDSDGATTPKKYSRRRPTILKESTHDVATFMSMMESTNKVRMEELALQKEVNAITARKLELDEKRYLLEKAEREARLALEQQERQMQIEFMRSTLDMMRAITKKV